MSAISAQPYCGIDQGHELSIVIGKDLAVPLEICFFQPKAGVTISARLGSPFSNRRTAAPHHPAGVAVLLCQFHRFSYHSSRRTLPSALSFHRRCYVARAWSRSLRPQSAPTSPDNLAFQAPLEGVKQLFRALAPTKSLRTAKSS